MKKLTDTTEHLYFPAQADTAALSLQAGDPDWRYVVTHDPTGRGYSFIEIYDEDGDLIAKY